MDKSQLITNIKNWKNQTFCVMPWVGFSATQRWDFRLCCLDNSSRVGNSLWSIDSMTIESYHLSEKLAKIRKQMLQGKKISNCENCYKQEEVSGESYRTWKNFYYKDQLPDIVESTDLDSWKTSFQFLYLDIRFSNICNLACRMCNGDSSSARIPIDSALWMDWHKIMWWKWDIEKFKHPSSYLQNLKHIYIAWWEPFIDKDQGNFIKELIQQGYSSDITLEYQTNLTKIDSDKLKTLWSFKKVLINISCDGIWKSYDYIRIWSTWSDFLEKYKLLWEFQKSLSDKIIISSHVVVQRDNVLDIPKLYVFLRRTLCTRVDLTILIEPSYLSINHIPLERKKEIIDYYNWWIKTHENKIMNIRKDLKKITYALESWKIEKEKDDTYYKNTKIIDSYITKLR